MTEGIPDAELFAHEPDADGDCRCGATEVGTASAEPGRCPAALFEHVEGLRLALKYAEQAKTHAQAQQTRLVMGLAQMLGMQHKLLGQVPKPIAAMLIGLGMEIAPLPKEDAELLVKAAVDQMKRKEVDPRVLDAALALVQRQEQEQAATVPHPGAAAPGGNSSEGYDNDELGPHGTVRSPNG